MVDKDTFYAELEKAGLNPPDPNTPLPSTTPPPKKAPPPLDLSSGAEVPAKEYKEPKDVVGKGIVGDIPVTNPKYTTPADQVRQQGYAVTNPKFANAEETKPFSVPEVKITGKPEPATGVGQGATGGGQGGNAFSIVKAIEGDTDEQLAAAQEEAGAKTAYAGDVGEALGQESQEMRGEAMAGQAQAHEQAQDNRAKIAEIGQLVEDYKNAKIDPDQWWSEKSVPQKIGATIGAFFAGISGGVQGAMNYVNGMIDRNLAIQQEAIHRKGSIIGESQNLLYSMMKNSNTEQEAFDKTRAAMINAAMVDVEKASVTAKAPIEVAQIHELMAALKQQRDMILARLLAPKTGTGVSPQGLQVEGKNVFNDPDTGQGYVLGDAAYADDVKNAITAASRLKKLLQDGVNLLNQRTTTDYINPLSDNIRAGENIDSFIPDIIAKLVGSRGVPPNLQHLIQSGLPKFGSRFAGLDRAKVAQMIRALDEGKASILEAAGATPAEISIGPGTGKKVGQLTYYAKGIGTKPAPTPTYEPTKPAKPSPGFQPNQ